MAFVGGLIFPSVIVLRQLDAPAARAALDLDDDFREPKLVDSDADGIGEEQRHEKPEIEILGQVATRRFEFGEQAPSGQVIETPDLEITFHGTGMKAAGLIAADGRCKLIPGDRLVRISNRAGVVQHTFPNPPGMFLLSVRPSGFLGGGRNLFVCTFSDRRRDAIVPAPREREN